MAKWAAQDRRDYILLEVIVSKPSLEARMWMEFWAVIKPIYTDCFTVYMLSLKRKDSMHGEKDREDDATHILFYEKISKTRSDVPMFE